MIVQGAVVVTLTLVLASTWASHFKVLCRSFLCYEQGTVRGAILSGDRSCFMCTSAVSSNFSRLFCFSSVCDYRQTGETALSRILVRIQ